MTPVLEMIAELQRQYASDPLKLGPTSEDMSRWGRALGDATFYDDIAAELARAYHLKRYSFEFCDSVINRLFAALMAAQPSSWPKLFQRVYDAFEAGEFHRRADKTDNPIAEHTDPEIAAIVRRL